MKIVLLRHGKPDVPDFGKIKAVNLGLWVNAYNNAGLNKQHQPPPESVAVVSQCNAVLCSDLTRSLESAAMLGLSQITYIKSLCREMGLPHGRFPFAKLSVNSWAVLFRLLWFCGYSKNSESFVDAKYRARASANLLKKMAQEQGSVIFVGHGLINRFIAKELLNTGWQGPVSPGKKYWQFGQYTLSK